VKPASVNVEDECFVHMLSIRKRIFARLAVK